MEKRIKLNHSLRVAAPLQRFPMLSDSIIRFGVFIVAITAPPWLLHTQSAFSSECPSFASGVSLGTVESYLINEASGLAASRQNTDVFWINNDSGDSARLFALNREGTHLGIYNITGASAIDWEDIAIGPGPSLDEHYLYIGDIGDNSAARSAIVVYRVPEPTVAADQAPVNVNVYGAESITLQYPDGPRDAETLMVDPITRDIYIVSKRDATPRLYRAAFPQSTTGTITMEFKAQVPLTWATGGDISPLGRMIIVRNPVNAAVWLRPANSDLWQVFSNPACATGLLWEPQGEAICFDPNNDSYYTVSENLYQPIYYYHKTSLFPLPADYNLDTLVDLVDLAFLAWHWLDQPDEPCPADLNGDRENNLIDFTLLAKDWLVGS